MAERQVDLTAYTDQRMFVGDIHNHCGISYGHGTIEDAYANARLQLDFASVTGHAWWHDMPVDDPDAAAIVEYHREGFGRLAKSWEHVQEVTAETHDDGRFVSFLSFEWHSLAFGDHCIYFNGDRGELIRANGLDELRAELRRVRAAGGDAMALPHHIGYRPGRRGVNWSTYTSEFSPVVEIVSMHGCAESDDAPRPHLHTMGPRHSAHTAVAGLRLGHRFGLIGSTDHHSAHPGSFGHGRVAVWAPELTRDAIWDAFQRRRVYALTGDPIVAGFSVNDTPMGGEAPASRTRQVEAEVQAEAPLDCVEVLRNGRVLHRVSRHELTTDSGMGKFRGTVAFFVGWGDVGVETPWDITISVEQGRLTGVTPRLRGADIVQPDSNAPEVYHFSSWGRRGDSDVWLRTVTKGNPNVVTDGTQGLNLHIDGDDRTRVTLTANGTTAVHAIGELRSGSAELHLAGFLSPAVQVGRAIPDAELYAVVELDDHGTGSDWYHLRVRQTNDQWVWTTPVWVGPATAATSEEHENS